MMMMCGHDDGGGREGGRKGRRQAPGAPALAVDPKVVVVPVVRKREAPTRLSTQHALASILSSVLTTWYICATLEHV